MKLLRWETSQRWRIGDGSYDLLYVEDGDLCLNVHPATLLSAIFRYILEHIGKHFRVIRFARQIWKIIEYLSAEMLE